MFGWRGWRTRSTVAALGIIFLIAAAGMVWIEHHTSRYDSLIRRAATRNGVDFYLVKALIFEESWFRPDIRGSAGEQGLMQITAAAAADYSATKGFPAYQQVRLLEPELNVEIGCWYLRQSLDHYRDSPQPLLFALLRYNAGESRADNWLRKALSASPPEGVSAERHYLSFVDFPKTRAYARRILRRSQTRNFWY
jgi:soluble lytic murein transglycosylase